MQSSRIRPIGPSVDDAAALAAAALGFLAADGERLEGFLALTGIAPQDIRRAAGESLFLAGVLDHILSDEAGLLLPFAAAEGVRLEDVAAARRALAGELPDA